MIRTLVTAVLSLGFAGCGVLPPTSVEEALASGDSYTVDVRSFDASERTIIGECFTDWEAFSGGKVQLQAVVEEGDFAFRRGSFEGAYSHIARAKREAWLDADAAPLAALCRHAIGRTLRLPMTDAPGVMSNRRDGLTVDFTDSDHVGCVEAGVCE